MLNTNTQICLDQGGELVSLDYLRGLHDPAHGGTRPARTDSHYPVPFFELVDVVMSKVERLYTGVDGQFEIANMHLALNKDETRIFGLLVLQEKEPDLPIRAYHEDEYSWSKRMVEYRAKVQEIRDKPTGWMIGFRGSIDKSLASAMVIGLSVFICENLCISGGANSIFVCQKNTRNGLDAFRSRATVALHDAEGIVGAIQHDLDAFRSIPASLEEMAKLTGLAQYEKVITSQQANEVYRQIGNASMSRDERTEKGIRCHFTGRTLWDAYNHLTEGVKIGRLDNTFRKHRDVHDFFVKEVTKIEPELLLA